MKRSFNSKYHILIMILFGMIVLQSVLMLYAIDDAKSLKQLSGDMQSIIIIFFFIIFIYMIVIYNYIPYRLNRALREIQGVIDEISDGNYSMEIDPTIYDNDSIIQNLVLALKKMLNIIVRFDLLKADKIFEHNQRIQQLMNLLPQKIIILSANGEAIYINDAFRKTFDSITENVNINELIFKDEYKSKLFSLIIDALRNGNNVYNAVVTSQETSESVSINASIVRNRKGVSSGAVFVLESQKHAAKA